MFSVVLFFILSVLIIYSTVVQAEGTQNTKPSPIRSTLAAIQLPMCMTFYIGSNQELPIIAFDKNSPAFNTTPLNEDEKAIYKHISLANVVNFGSDQGCGCGFRHSLLENGNWLCVEVEDESPAEREAIQKNHEELYRYIKTFVSNKSQIEIYGCWNGDFDDVGASVEEIMIDDLIDKNFYFKERGFYTLNHGG